MYGFVGIFYRANKCVDYFVAILQTELHTNKKTKITFTALTAAIIVNLIQTDLSILPTHYKSNSTN